MQLIDVSKRIYNPFVGKTKISFLNYAIADGFFTVLNKTFVGIQGMLYPKNQFVTGQLTLL